MGNISQVSPLLRAYYTNLSKIKRPKWVMREKSYEQVPVHNSPSYEQFRQVDMNFQPNLCPFYMTVLKVMNRQVYTYEQVIDNLGNVMNRL